MCYSIRHVIVDVYKMEREKIKPLNEKWGGKMVDLHTHILAEIDDGAQSMEMSLEMARIAYMMGTRHIIATPHYIPGQYETSYIRVKDKVKELNERLREKQIEVVIYPGQEVKLVPNITQHLWEKKIGTLNQSQYMLIELPQVMNEGLWYELDLLIAVGIKPVIAHIERNTLKRKNRWILNELVKRGCYFQITVGSICGNSGYKMKRWCHKLLKMRYAHVLASDMHHTVIRGPELKRGYHIMESRRLAAYMKRNAEQILRSKKIHDLEESKRPSGRIKDETRAI